MTLTIYLVRHGETAFNRDGKGLGRADEPLTEVGENQARLTGQAFANRPIGQVLTSPLSRARRVAEAIASNSGAPIEPRDSLVEMDLGSTEGVTYAETAARYPDFMRQWAGPGAAHAIFPGGESVAGVAARAAPVLAALPAHQEGRLVIVSHNFVLRALLCTLLDVPIENFRAFQLDLASITTVSIRGGRAAVGRLNDVCHLESLNLGPPARSV